MTEEKEYKLTDEQVENWREVLLGMVGPYARIMPREQIEKMRDVFEAKAFALEREIRESIEELPFSEGDKVKVSGSNAFVKEIHGDLYVTVKMSYGGTRRVHKNAIEVIE